jgi:hypothetical protein
MPLMAHQRLPAPVTVCCGTKANDWAYRSVRLVEHIQPNTNVVGSPSPASTPGV